MQRIAAQAHQQGPPWSRLFSVRPRGLRCAMCHAVHVRTWQSGRFAMTCHASP